MNILSLESGHLLRMSAYITFSLLSLVALTYKFDSMNTEQTSHSLLYYVSEEQVTRSELRFERPKVRAPLV